MSKVVFSYAQKLSFINSYINVGIKSKKNLTKAEKSRIDYYFRRARELNLIVFDPDKKEYIQKAHFVKSTSAKKKAEHGINNKRWKGFIVKGAKAEDKVVGNKIIRNGYDKIFIPLDFSDAPIEEDEPEISMADFTAAIVYDALSEFIEEIKSSDYFTIRLAIGYEIGQKQSRKIKKEFRREGTVYGRGTPVDKKLKIIIRQLVEKVPDIITNERSKYRDLVEIYNYKVVDGVYLYKFKNQRQPNKEETKRTKKKRRKKA